jgi:hypothetical protein
VFGADEAQERSDVLLARLAELATKVRRLALERWPLAGRRPATR